MILARFTITVEHDDGDEERFVKTSVSDAVYKVFEYIYESEKTAADVIEMMESLFYRGEYSIHGRDCDITVKMEMDQ